MHDAVVAEFGDGNSDEDVGTGASRLEDVMPEFLSRTISDNDGRVEPQSQELSLKNAVDDV